MNRRWTAAALAAGLMLLAGATGAAAQAETETPTPFGRVTLPASPTPDCPNTPPNRLILLERGRVAYDDPTDLNVRAEPGTASDLVGTLPAGSVFMVLEGPLCTAVYAWFRIEAGELTGWIAEGRGQLYFVEPYAAG